MQLPGIPTGVGVGGQVPAHRAGGSTAQVLSDHENPDGAVPGASGAPFIPSHLFCILEDTAGGIVRYWPALSGSLPPAHTEKSSGPDKRLLLT